MDPLTFADDVERRKRMLPMSLGSQDMLTTTAQPRVLRRSLGEQAAALRQQAADLDAKEPDMAALQAYARQQGESGSAAMLNALAAQYAGERFQPVQAQLLRRAMAAQEPMKVGGGVLTPDGQFVKDPFADRARRIERLEQQAMTLEKADAEDRSRAERLAYRCSSKVLNYAAKRPTGLATSRLAPCRI
jgi:hypothetical protein